MEECVRACIGLFLQHAVSAAAISVRGKFSRLREIMQILTTESSAGASSSSIAGLAYLSEAEYFHFVSLRKV